MSASIMAKIVSQLKHLLRNLVNAKDFIIRHYKALEGSVLWILHLPKAAATAISRWISRTGRLISDVGQAIKATIQAVLRVVAIGITTALSLVLLYITFRAMVKVFRIYQREKYLQTQRELHAQLQKKEAEQRARMLEDARSQARLEESRSRQEELGRHREALEAQRRADDEKKAYRQWLCQCEALLSCRETMTRFPDPPFWPCTFRCQPNGGLKACPHSIKRLFQASGADLKGFLEKERVKWHPDKFERCPGASREHLKAKAEELFKLIHTLLDDA
jgi:type II secretory pathway component PulM